MRCFSKASTNVYFNLCIQILKTDTLRNSVYFNGIIQIQVEVISYMKVWIYLWEFGFGDVVCFNRKPFFYLFHFYCLYGIFFFINVDQIDNFDENKKGILNSCSLNISTFLWHVLFFMNLSFVSLISCSAYVYMKEHSTQYYQRTRYKGLLLPASIYRYTVMLLAECLRRRKSVLRVSIAGMIYEYWRHPA